MMELETLIGKVNMILQYLNSWNSPNLLMVSDHGL